MTRHKLSSDAEYSVWQDLRKRPLIVDCGRFLASQGKLKTLALLLLLRGGVERHADLLGLDFILVVIPRADSGVDKATKEEKKTDKQYNTGHSTVESVPSSYAGGL